MQMNIGGYKKNLSIVIIIKVIPLFTACDC